MKKLSAEHVARLCSEAGTNESGIVKRFFGELPQHLSKDEAIALADSLKSIQRWSFDTYMSIMEGIDDAAENNDN